MPAPRAAASRCRLCGAGAVPQFEAIVLGTVRARFDLCPVCDYLQAADPHWLSEAYRNPIGETDSGILLRNQYCAVLTASLLERHFDMAGMCLDYGGGYGLLVRTMTNMGFRFLWADRHAPNLFAPEFSRTGQNGFELVTSFETFEHFVDPAAEIAGLFAWSDSILFSTGLRPVRVPAADWPYYAFAAGQHIGLFSIDTLRFLARRHAATLYTDRSGFHLLTRRRLAGFSMDCTPGWNRWAGTVHGTFATAEPPLRFDPLEPPGAQSAVTFPG